MNMILKAATVGFGLAYVLEDKVATMLADGQLACVLADWCPSFPGYHLYYPSSRQLAPALELLKEALRYRGPMDAISSTTGWSSPDLGAYNPSTRRGHDRLNQ